ncbi:MAG: sulfatase [Akkermansiaceae bacterium]
MIRLLCLLSFLGLLSVQGAARPNILFMISDDQSYPHASAYGSKMVSTPNFDRIASEGVLFTDAVCASPGCSPSRAAILTGRQTWQIEHAGTHDSSFGKRYTTVMDLLDEAGYHAGFVGKGWGPGNWQAGGRTSNPAGKSYGGHGGSYAESFAKFLKERPEDAPFVFWFGSSDPHRGYKKGSGLAAGKILAQAEVPPFLPDSPEIRSDLLDYAAAVDRFDRDCGQLLKLLKGTGEYDNTIIIITSDNGMPFPYAKANCNEYGIHMPLAISWKNRAPGGRTSGRLVSLIDVTATLHAATGIRAPDDLPLAGKSFLSHLENKGSDPAPSAVFSARERHSSSRYHTLGYPQRCIRTATHLYIRNFTPERWPAGPGQKLSGKRGSPPGPEHGGYHEIDSGPSLTRLIEGRDDPKIAPFFHLAVAPRPAEELYDITADPGCVTNLAADLAHATTKTLLAQQLEAHLKQTGDPRVTGNGDIFETYPRYTNVRWFPKPDWAIENPDSVPPVPWLKERE